MDNTTTHTTDENMPPWDINRVSPNPIDHKLVFTKPLDIFSMTSSETKPTIKQPAQTPIKQETNNTPKTKETPIESTEAIALALKYRPKTFAELVGQESVARTLCLALDSKKIANAYLFSGLRGSGKTSSARILARSLQCERGITSSPCGACANCIAALKGAHLDITELDGASNRKIDDMRDLLEQTKYKPTMGRFKIFIIDEVHMLTKEAFNSLLKTLEEPPNYVKFILATTDPLKVPATILSRTQHFRFKKIPTTALKNHLAHILQKENVSSDEASLDMLIRNGHGSLRDTLTLLDQAIVFCQNSLNTQKLADMLGALDPSAFDTLFQALLRKDMQECIKFAKSLEGYEIEMILDELSLYIKNKMLEEIPQIPPVLGMRYANIINDSKAMLQLDCDSDFCLLLTILKMLEAQKIREVANALKQLESIQTPAQNAQITQLSNEYIATQNSMESRNAMQVDSINPIKDSINPTNTKDSINKDSLPQIQTSVNSNLTTESSNKDSITHINTAQDSINPMQYNDSVKNSIDSINATIPTNSKDSISHVNSNSPNSTSLDSTQPINATAPKDSITDSITTNTTQTEVSNQTTQNLQTTQIQQNTQNLTQDSNAFIESKTNTQESSNNDSITHLNTTQDSNIQTESKLDSNNSQHFNNQTESNNSIESNPTQQSQIDSINTQQEAHKQPFSLTKNDNLFTTLIAKLYERDYNIGNLFENKIAFDKLTGNVLHLIFYTTEEETGTLRQAYSGIMQVMKEVYGDSIKMQVVKQNPQDLEKLMQNTTTRATQITHNKLQTKQNLNETTDKNPTHTQQAEPQNLNTETNNNQAMSADPAMQFIAQNSDMLKSMQNELGIKDMKVISLPVSTTLQ
ncbi:DNA polymerase III subunit gamma/tau [Helicobacter bilis]|uniref:DNA polymerase III subunit gamma/tau n=1 Tax=Helicobacter bilis TaxID=37372 RepID=UPI0026EEF285|nr:DNA polymerase III subunit gamma/tau [Helicobacter bilis]MCI7411373.1 DNA polymerase III subunit gamma/tau [Helicobacter bilis]MDD7297458.1 DNA polymerase III subunit gamma/tau [Helicobacter bilis]MDY4400259.1 DNA polymerase III subunit gamma/tau [Helicobacter bilis]